MPNPWTIVRCRVFGLHRWETVEVRGDRGWACRTCDEVVLDRYFLEREHDPYPDADVSLKRYGAAAGVASPPVV